MKERKVEVNVVIHESLFHEGTWFYWKTLSVFLSLLGCFAKAHCCQNVTSVHRNLLILGMCQ